MGDPDMFDVPADLLRSVARSQPQQEITAATPEHVDVVVNLQTVSRGIAEHCRRVMLHEPVDWTELAHRLDEAAGQCRRQIVIEAAECLPPAGGPTPTSGGG